MGDYQARFCERLKGKLLRPTRLCGTLTAIVKKHREHKIMKIDFQIPILFFLLILIFSCSRKNVEKEDIQFKSFIFHASGESFDYSIKITNTDSFYVEKIFPDPKENFYGILKQEEMDSLNYFLKKINLFKYDSLYVNHNMVDASGYAFFIMKDSIYKSVGIYGYDEPKELYSFAKWIKNLKKRIKIYPMTKNINFEKLKYKMFSPPPPPPEKIIKGRNNSR